MRAHGVELTLAYLPHGPRFRCARCGGEVDCGPEGWAHVERLTG